MSELKNLPKKKYDVAVFGSNLSSYLLASALSKKLHLSVCLLDSDRSTEGALEQDSFFTHTPASDSDILELSTFVSDLIQDSYLETEDVALQTSTVESGKLTPFLGFEDKNLASQTLISNLVPISGHKLNMNSHELIERLKSTFIGDIYNLATVTEFVLNEESGEISHALVNGDLKLKADLFISGLDAESTVKLFPMNTLPAKVVQKIAKLTSWSQVNLFCELPLANELPESQYVLMGQKNDFEPCFGEIYASGDKKFARFSSFATDESAADHEHLGAVLRYMKRQIKRLEPEFFEQTLSERMVVQNKAEAFTDLGLKVENSFPQISGFFFCHPNWRQESGLVSELAAAQSAFNSISELKSLPKEASEVLLANSSSDEATPPSLSL